MFEDLFLNHSIIVNDEELERYSKTWKRPKIYSNINNKREDINYVYEENINSNITSMFEPRGAQIEALYELKKTRLDGNDKALVVAATGIGKTYLAAFDSREFNRVLFVAHREEILKQAYESFANVRIDKWISVIADEEKLVADKEELLEYKVNDKTAQEYEYNMGFFMNSTKDTKKDIIFASDSKFRIKKNT